jgi:hypothetical protein
MFCAACGLSIVCLTILGFMSARWAEKLGALIPGLLVILFSLWELARWRVRRKTHTLRRSFHWQQDEKSGEVPGSIPNATASRLLWLGRASVGFTEGFQHPFCFVIVQELRVLLHISHVDANASTDGAPQIAKCVAVTVRPVSEALDICVARVAVRDIRLA